MIVHVHCKQHDSDFSRAIFCLGAEIRGVSEDVRKNPMVEPSFLEEWLILKATNHAQLMRKITSPMPDFCEKVFEKRFQVDRRSINNIYIAE